MLNRTTDISLQNLSPTGTPLFVQVKSAVLNSLASGEWQQGEAIPAEKTLSQRFNVSIGTLRKAIDELVAENILVRHQGRGTFVVVHDRNQHFFRFFRIVGQDGTKRYPTTTLHSFKLLDASPLIQEKLQLKDGSKVFEFINILSLDNKKTIVDIINVPESLFPGLSHELLKNRKSTVYSFYQKSFGINIIGTTEHLRIAPKKPEVNKLLGIPQNTPLLQIRRTAYSYNSKPVEWRLSHIDTTNYEYLGLEHEH